MSASRMAFRVAGAAVVCCAVVTLGVEAAGGVRTTDALSSQAAVRGARDQDLTIDCLAGEARALVAAGTPVAIVATPGAAPPVPLYQAVDQWADLVATPAAATVVLTLRRAYPQGGGCAGQEVVSETTRPAGPFGSS